MALLPRGARADRARRSARLRHGVGGRAPLPDRVRALARRPRSSSPPSRSARKRIRIGHGVVLLPHKFNHPDPRRRARRRARPPLERPASSSAPAARASTSRRASRSTPSESRDMWQESLEIIPRMWTEDPVRVPRPVRQRPAAQHHPEAAAEAASADLDGGDQPAVAGSSPGRNGIGILGLTIFVSVPQLAGPRARLPRGARARRSRSASSSTTGSAPSPSCTSPRPASRRSPTAAPTRRSTTCSTPSACSAAAPIPGDAGMQREYAGRRDQEHAVPRPDRQGVPDHRSR